MSFPALIYVIDHASYVNQQLQPAADRLGCRLIISRKRNDHFEEALQLSPDILIYSKYALEPESVLLFRRMCADPQMCNCTQIMMLESVHNLHEYASECESYCEWSEGGPDDFLRRDASPLEIMARLQAGLRLSHLRKRYEATKNELDSYRNQIERDGDYLNDATAQLVEIAAELQSEVCHSAQREEESVRVAQVDTIAQAAATLRHEINNPLFAIAGSVESSLQRLRLLQARYPEKDQDFNVLVNNMERVQRGSERIEKVVQAISATLEASKKDYVEGVPMLQLHQQA